MKLVLASRNAHKAREFGVLLAPHELVPLFHQAQETISYHEGWLRTESPPLGRAYAKFVNELKQSLTEYARDKNNAVLMEKANLLITDESDFNTINADLNTILLYLKSEQNNHK